MSDAGGGEADSTPFLEDVKVTVEQARRGGGEQWAEDGSLGAQPTTKPLWRRHLLQAIGRGLFVISIGLIVVLQVSDILAGSSATARVDSTGKDDDYILDPKWPFNAPPQKREYYWTITDESFTVGDAARQMILINGQFPGPLIEVNDGDTLVVHVDNQASNATSIHWHGIYNKGSNWFDGTTGVTQCPIASQSSFTYELKIEGQAGTYWYHAHLAVQTADGLYGPLIVHAQDEYSQQQQIPYTSDRIVMVQDRYDDLSAQLLVKYLEPDNENAEPIPDGVLINGHAFQDCSAQSDENCTRQVPTFELAAGEGHRLRFIHVGVFATFDIRIQSHELAITEVDGTDVIPTRSKSMLINPGQRYSIVLTANQTEADSFWLRAKMNTNCFDGRVRGIQSESLGLVRYQSSPPLANSSDAALPDLGSFPSPPTAPECSDMELAAFRPAKPVAAPAKPDTTFYIRTNFEIGAHRLSRGFFNSSSLRLDMRSPALHRMISGIRASNASFSVLEPPPLILPTIFGPQPFPPLKDKIGVNTKAYDASRELVLQTPDTNKVVDLIFVNFDDGAHPLHLHGHKFYVLGQGKTHPPASILNLATEDAKDEAAQLDLAHALLRDTAVVRAFGWIHLRVVLDNAGLWLLHCHNAWHAEAGMGLMLAVGVEEIAKQVHSQSGGWAEAIDAQTAMCGLDGVERGERPPDSVWGHRRRQPLG